MPCCKAEEYKWCRDLSVVGYKDVEDNEYCIFHAPKGEKGITLQDFNKLIFERIDEANKESKSCNLSGTVFEGDITFDLGKDNLLLGLNFSSSTFSGRAWFIGTLSDDTDFSRAMFDSEAFFLVTFLGNASFFSAIFRKYANFSEAKFNKNTVFAYATFNEKASFLKSIFNKEADFLGATFNQLADFSKAKFFKKANFSSDGHQAIFNGKANFSKAEFCEEAEFPWAEFIEKTDFSDAKFFRRVNFFNVKFKEEADFAWTIFGGEAHFRHATFVKEANFFKSEFVNDGEFTILDIEKEIRFEGANLEAISFLDSDLRKFDFINCKWPPKKDGRKVLYDEIELFKNKKDKDFKTKIEKVETLYRQLKQKCKEDHNEYEVSNWHYGEKEMQRKGSSWKNFSFYLLNLYWVSSGYGERPLRAGIVLVLLIIAISVILGLTGIKSLYTDDVIKIRELSEIWNLDYLKATLQYTTFEPKPDFIPSNWFLKIAAKLLIPLQAALFALAVRNRFRR
ncbi:MAG: pentapeptide repeat-containing protein [Nitrospirota bacterium]